MAMMKKLQHFSDLWGHTMDADPDDKCQYGFCRYMEVASLSCHPNHSCVSSVHLPIFLVIGLTFSQIRFVLAFQNIFWANFFLRCLILSSVKFLHFFQELQQEPSFLLCTLHGSSWKKGLYDLFLGLGFFKVDIIHFTLNLLY